MDDVFVAVVRRRGEYHPLGVYSRLELAQEVILKHLKQYYGDISIDVSRDGYQYVRTGSDVGEHALGHVFAWELDSIPDDVSRCVGENC